MVTEGSLYLYEALDKKVYFKEATILVPPQWNNTHFTKARTESFEKVQRIMPFYIIHQIFTCSIISITFDIADTISMSNTGQNNN